MKKIPMRMCVVTRERYPKKDLIRVVKTEEGVIVDLTGKVNGHGVYLKKDISTIEMAQSKKMLNHALETDIPESIYEELKTLVN